MMDFWEKLQISKYYECICFMCTEDCRPGASFWSLKDALKLKIALFGLKWSHNIQLF